MIFKNIFLKLLLLISAAETVAQGLGSQISPLAGSLAAASQLGKTVPDDQPKAELENPSINCLPTFELSEEKSTPQSEIKVTPESLSFPEVLPALSKPTFDNPVFHDAPHIAPIILSAVNKAVNEKNKEKASEKETATDSTGSAAATGGSPKKTGRGPGEGEKEGRNIRGDRSKSRKPKKEARRRSLLERS